ncbi:MAG: radical SAM protein [Ruminiclostridium sp.]|nr:radical SAM protein [Ruminiclostridium sp.]
MSDKPDIFNIERFAINDGPGIRTAVFFQGCPLRCKWCANPESQMIGKHSRTISCDELFDIVLRDKDYYDESGGGVTLTGGEALLQINSVLPFLESCRKSGISIAIETCGCISIEKVEIALIYADLFLFDIKTLDRDLFTEYTGGSLDTVMRAFRRICSDDPRKIIVRVPVIPTFNETEIPQIIDFAAVHGITELHLLPYHTLGVAKYKQLGRRYEFSVTESLDPAVLKQYIPLGKKAGIRIKIGG